MRVFLVSYATERFEAVRRELNDSAKQFGITDILSYTENDLHASDYYLQNKSILDEICGAGYWAWKPYFILRALEALKDGDVLFYCDAGSAFIDSPAPLVKLATEQPQGLILFDARPLQNRQFTKRDCFVRMGCDEVFFWDASMVVATILIIRKCSFTLTFLNEWLHYCQDRAVITDDANVCGKDNLPGYFQHRHDQAILSALAAKHKIETYRNPTLWGNYLKPSQFRVLGEPVVSPFNLVPEIKAYASTPQENSPYGTIFVINRQPNMVGKKPIPQMHHPDQPVLAKNFSPLLPRVIRKLKNKLLPKNGKKSDLLESFGKKSYSQCGEDLLVDYVFRLRGITHPSYIDIGANHPYFISNTAMFYERGCRGINIEANPQLIPAFETARPKDINLNVGISGREGELEFYIMEDNTLSTFSKEERDYMVSNGKKLTRIEKIKLKTVAAILADHFNNTFPDFLSLDAEGMDFDILKSINFEKYSPKVICVEAAEYSPIGAGKRRTELIDYLGAKGFYEYANTNLNAIMVKRSFWFI